MSGGKRSAVSICIWAFRHIKSCLLPVNFVVFQLKVFCLVSWNRYRVKYDKESREFLLSNLGLLCHSSLWLLPPRRRFRSADAGLSHTSRTLFYCPLLWEDFPPLLTGHKPVEILVEGPCETNTLENDTAGSLLISTCPADFPFRTKSVWLVSN